MTEFTDAEIAAFAIREWLAAVADTDERRAVREMATAAMKEIGRLQRVERAAQAYVMAGLCGNQRDDQREKLHALIDVARTDL